MVSGKAVQLHSAARTSPALKKAAHDALPSGTRHGAHVAPQRCTILRSGKAVTSYHIRGLFYPLKFKIVLDLGYTSEFGTKANRPKKNDFQPIFLDAAQLAELFKAVKGTKLELVVLVTAFYGLPRMRFHDLRHSCASLLLANGVPLKQIQEWLGHSDFSTTANIYAHLDYRSKLSSAKAMVEGISLPEADHFGSRWVRIEEND